MLEIIILAAVAVFILSRLYQILGQKTGFENPSMGKTMSDNLKGAFEDIKTQEKDDILLEGPLQHHIKAIKEHDPSFRVDDFMEGATKAFDMLVHAFAKGDDKILRRLLDESIYTDFEKAIQTRTEKQQRLSTTLVKIDPHIIHIDLKDTVAYITVKFISEQTNIIYGPNNQILEGRPNQIEEVNEEWVFKRDLKQPDPNWIMVDIKS